jgi:putative transposase
MRKSRFSEEQIVGVLREAEAGIKPADLCRKHGISMAPSTGGSKFGGMAASEVRKLKALEDENTTHKRLLAEAQLDIAALKTVVSNNWRPCRLPGEREVSVVELN